MHGRISPQIEHRLFSHITMNWRGRPLTSHEVIVQAIAGTTTRTGLRVRADLDTGAYDTGIKISDAQMDALPLTRHDWHGDWNYTLRPEDYDQAAGVPDPFRPGPARSGLALPPGTDRAASRGVGRPDRSTDNAARPAAGNQPGQTPWPPPPADRTGHRPTARPHPGRPAPGHCLAPAPRSAASRHRYPIQRPPGNHQQAHPRHPPAARTGPAHHPARSAPASPGLDDLSNLAAAEGILIPAEIKTSC